MRSQTGRLIEVNGAALRLARQTCTGADAHREPVPALPGPVITRAARIFVLGGPRQAAETTLWLSSGANGTVPTGLAVEVERVDRAVVDAEPLRPLR